MPISPCGIGAVALLAGISVSCGGGGGGGGVAGPPADGSAVEILLTDALRFQPANLAISPGTTVRWRNTSALPHTVSPDGHQAWGRAALGSRGQTFTHTFPTTGTFSYFCELHPPGMVGTIVVQAGAAAGNPGPENGADPDDPDYPGL